MLRPCFSCVVYLMLLLWWGSISQRRIMYIMYSLVLWGCLSDCVVLFWFVFVVVSLGRAVCV